MRMIFIVIVAFVVSCCYLQCQGNDINEVCELTETAFSQRIVATLRTDSTEQSKAESEKQAFSLISDRLKCEKGVSDDVLLRYGVWLKALVHSQEVDRLLAVERLLFVAEYESMSMMVRATFFDHAFELMIVDVRESGADPEMAESMQLKLDEVLRNELLIAQARLSMSDSLGRYYMRIGEKEKAEPYFFEILRYPCFVMPTDEFKKSFSALYEQAAYSLVECRKGSVAKLRQLSFWPVAVGPNLAKKKAIEAALSEGQQFPAE